MKERKIRSAEIGGIENEEKANIDNLFSIWYDFFSSFQ